MQRYYFYQSINRKIIPVEEEDINKKAHEILNQMKKQEIIKTLPKRFINNWNDVSLYHPSGVLEKATAIILDPSDGAYSIKNKLNHLTGKEWTLFIKSWFVFDALHSDLKEEKLITQKFELNSEEHPATYSPTMISNFIKFFTKEGETVFDPFNGIGTTLVACDRTDRKGIGVELNKKYCQITKSRTKQKIIHGSSENLKNIFKKNKIKNIDFSISSPPYWNILQRSTKNFKKSRSEKNLDVQYSETLDDIGNIESYEDFLEKLTNIYLSMFDILKKNGYLVVIIKNVKKNGKNYPLAWDLASRLSKKYVFRDELIWCQSKVGLAPFGYPSSYTSNIVHHYCLIFRKD